MKLLFCVATALSISVYSSRAQLLISEFLTNPSGTDSPFEWVELVAAGNIDFAVTPYSVVWANNTSTTFGTNGWATGFNVTYGFNITSGVINRGDIVYVGGSSLLPTGPSLRLINTATDGGDGGLGLAGSGVMGNGGGGADGIAVFNTSIENLTDSLAPMDAIFFGLGASNSVMNGGTAGYLLPNNDLYAGGFLQTNSFVAPDPGGGQTVIATGTFDTDTGTWQTPRGWVLGTMTDRASSVDLVPVPEPSTMALLGLMTATGLLLFRRRR